LTPIQHHLSHKDLLHYNLRGKGLEQEFYDFIQRRKRKAEETDAVECAKRVKRREKCLGRLCALLDKQVQAGAQRYNREHEAEVILEIQAKELRDEKERKKEMQRKRRRENAMRLETQKLNEAQKKLSKEEDEVEKEKLLREVEKARRKIKTTQRAIERSNEPGGAAAAAAAAGQDENAEPEKVTANIIDGDGPVAGGTRSKAKSGSPATAAASAAASAVVVAAADSATAADKVGKPEKVEKLEKPEKSTSARSRRAAASGERVGSRGGARPRKSKEKKQAEKDAAESAYAAMEKDSKGNLLIMTPKDEAAPPPPPPPPPPTKKETKREARAARAREKRELKEKELREKQKELEEKEKAEQEAAAAAAAATPQPPPQPTSTLDSKGYNQIYEQIWRDIARKDIPKVFRIKTMSMNTRQDNLRKTAQLASKQCKKWQDRTNKWHKDTQSRAKKTMREMMSFWKRNEREERDLRRLAEKQELESAKKAEADREANRQRRKLNFLISQTEIYSHFIGRKVKTSEVEAEHSGGGVEPATDVDRKAVEAEAGEQFTLPSGKITTKITNLDEVDFDAIDDATLREAAMANAQSAYETARKNARAFNEGRDGEMTAADQMAQMDEGELNFQNPTSLGDVEVSQPKMLTAQLKEYQLKGLNWLVNLYEQGINGILADEMGLGKTVQSISVMAYLAEVHDIWGPFLVIAPASTLHNWVQEITKFVPNIKALPYWGTINDRKILRKFWDRKHITYHKDSEFHVLVTSYQYAVGDAPYFQKVKWQYMILDEAQAIKSSGTTRWQTLLGFHCRNRLLLTGTPIQNSMQELWALLHFIMPTLFDSHDEFSEWFSKDIESHAQSNTKLNEDQLRRLHMILKPFMLRRVKKHVQKELGDKVEVDVFCDLTYRQRAYYTNLRNRVSILDLIEKMTQGDDSNSTTLMNLVMQFRKVCNHPDLFERTQTKSPLSLAYFAETASFIREGQFVDVGYSTRNLIEFALPRLLCSDAGQLDVPGHENARAGFEGKYLSNILNIWSPENLRLRMLEERENAFSWLRLADISAGEAYRASHAGVFERAVWSHKEAAQTVSLFKVAYEHEEEPILFSKKHRILNIIEANDPRALSHTTVEGAMSSLLNVSQTAFGESGLSLIEPCYRAEASAPPVHLETPGSSAANMSTARHLFNMSVRLALFGGAADGPTVKTLEMQMLEKKVDPTSYSWATINTPLQGLLPKPNKAKGRYTDITVPSMRRFVTDSGKLAKLDQLLMELKNGGHRVLLYFQMTRMIDLMEEYLTYRNYKYCRLDGSTKLEDRRDTVLDFQQRPEIFVFLLSTRAGGLGINLTAADTVIFYDSDWNPTIDSQAMDRAHRLGQTKQVTVYRLITRGTIEERIRKRALQKEEVQRVVISGGAGGGVDFNTRSRENKAKDIALWLADDDEAELIEQREKEAQDRGGAGADVMNNSVATKKGRRGGAAPPRKQSKKELSLDDMYHEGEGYFDDGSKQASGTGTPAELEIPGGGYINGGGGSDNGNGIGIGIGSRDSASSKRKPSNGNQRSRKARNTRESLSNRRWSFTAKLNNPGLPRPEPHQPNTTNYWSKLQRFDEFGYHGLFKKQMTYEDCLFYNTYPAANRYWRGRPSQTQEVMVSTVDLLFMGPMVRTHRSERGQVRELTQPSMKGNFVSHYRSWTRALKQLMYDNHRVDKSKSPSVPVKAIDHIVNLAHELPAFLVIRFFVRGSRREKVVFTVVCFRDNDSTPEK
ncbi:putative DNA helicase ino80, partial [Ascosphaera aggregata]